MSARKGRPTGSQVLRLVRFDAGCRWLRILSEFVVGTCCSVVTYSRVNSICQLRLERVMPLLRISPSPMGVRHRHHHLFGDELGAVHHGQLEHVSALLREPLHLCVAAALFREGELRSGRAPFTSSPGPARRAKARGVAGCPRVPAARARRPGPGRRGRAPRLGCLGRRQWLELRFEEGPQHSLRLVSREQLLVQPAFPSPVFRQSGG
jgi:hypothetical protein